MPLRGERIAAAIEKAWNERKPGSFTWGLGHAAVAQNRRAVYADGHAEMYGATDGQSSAVWKVTRTTTWERCSFGMNRETDRHRGRRGLPRAGSREIDI